MISLAVVEGKDDLCPNHVTGLDASGTIEIRIIKGNRHWRERPVPLQEKIQRERDSDVASEVT